MQANQTKTKKMLDTGLTLKELVTSDFSSTEVTAHTLSYHEMSSTPVQQVNELRQLGHNIEMLSQTVSKMQFMNREIRYLMKV